MVIEVYPIKRLPRKFKVFDYLVPPNLTLKRGDFVLIPWRNQEIWGVVAKIKEKHSQNIKLKTILKKMEELSLSEKEVDYYEIVAEDLVQSVASVLHAAFPKIPKRSKRYKKEVTKTYSLTLPKSEISNVQDILEKMNNLSQAFIRTSDLRRSAVIITGQIKDKIKETNLVICPNVRDAKLLAQGLDHLNPITISGQETPITRWLAWQTWRQYGGLFIGTRLSVLLLHPEIKNVFLIRSSHRNHKQNDRNPRYDTRQLLRKIKNKWSFKYWQMDVQPRVDDLMVFQENEFLGQTNPIPVNLVEKQKEKNTSPHPLLGSTTIQAIEKTLLANQKVICVYNKKGVSRQLKCQACGYQFFCPDCQLPYLVYEHTIRCHHCNKVEVKPNYCPQCQSPKIISQGFGNRLMARLLQKLFPQNFISLIEKDNILGTGLKADISVVTNYFLENLFNPYLSNDIGLVVDLNADMALYEPSFRGIERAFINLENWRGLARAYQANFIIQTNTADLFKKYLIEEKKILKNELIMRQDFGQPPMQRWIRIEMKDISSRQKEIDLNLLKQKIKAIDPDAIFINHQEDSIYEIGFNLNKTSLILIELNKLNDRYIIDSNANS